MDKHVAVDISDDVATITLARPRKRNALNREMVRHLRASLDELMSNEALRVVVLRHEGPVFCAGWDVIEPRDVELDATDLARIIELILTAPLPVVVRLEGGAMGAGMALVAACDIAVTVPTSQFAFSEVRVGVLPALVSYPVSHRAGKAVPSELFLTGRTFTAEEARDHGLVTTVVPAEAMEGALGRIIDQLRSAAPVAVAATKRLLLGRSTDEVRGDLEQLALQSMAMFSTPEAVAGLRAFAERRQPEWPQRSSATGDP